MNEEAAAGVLPGPGSLKIDRAAIRSIWAPVPMRWQLGAVALVGVVAAAGVGYLTSINPRAGPAHVAALLRVATIVALIAVGMYARTSPTRLRIGALLVATGYYACFWLLNGSADRLAFSIGLLSSMLAPTVFAYLMLAHPSGRLERPLERKFLVWAGGSLAVSGTILVLTSVQPPLRTPLVRCGPHCPANIAFLGGLPSGLDSVLKAALVLLWTSVACGTAVLLYSRVRRAAAPVRVSLLPVAIAAGVNAVLFLAYLAATAVGFGRASALGAAYVEVAVVIPLAILVGLSLERLFMGRALAEFVRQLVVTPQADPQSLMASALKDPSLRITYARPGTGTYVDAVGTPAVVPDSELDCAVAWIQRGRHPVAAVTYSANLADQASFVEAAGVVAMMRLEAVQLKADLGASANELAASRTRLVESADAERRRIERDLHDGTQQHLLGLRLKLDLAAEAVKVDPAEGQRLLASIGRQMDDLGASVRAFARGVYPSLLTEHGLTEALRSAARRSPLPVPVRARAIGRYPLDVEVAVYFCCLEALQNAVKHGEASTRATVRLWQEGQSLRFAVSDSGPGFDPQHAHSGHGLLNMRDRIASVGGTLSVTSRQGHGTVVRGTVPTNRR